ncbi:MAG TPA: site-specific integrase [Xanthobacteraceae bacterium]|nr:site-specific integrase [Xanthobacteraceae bacterium]
MSEPRGHRRSHGEAAHTFLRGKTWWARFTVAGREFRGSLRTGDEATARRRAKEWRDREVGLARFGEDRKTYVDVFTDWSIHIVDQVGPETSKRYAVSLGQLAPHLKPRFFDEIDRQLVADIVRARRAQGVTVATIRRDLTALSSVIEYAIDEGWRPDDSNPALARLRRLREKRDPIVLPKAEDIAFVAGRAKGNFRKLIEAAVTTGCRQDELVKAERRDLDHERRQLTIRRKGNQIRTISLSPEAWAVFASIPAFLNGRWLFWHGNGELYRNVASQFREQIKTAQKAAQKEERDFRPFTFHHLRHYFAVHYLKNGGNIYDLQRHLNHRSITTTELYLAHLTPEEAEAAKRGTSQNTAHLQRSTEAKT